MAQSDIPCGWTFRILKRSDESLELLKIEKEKKKLDKKIKKPKKTIKKLKI